MKKVQGVFSFTELKEALIYVYQFETLLMVQSVVI